VQPSFSSTQEYFLPRSCVPRDLPLIRLLVAVFASVLVTAPPKFVRAADSPALGGVHFPTEKFHALLKDPDYLPIQNLSESP